MKLFLISLITILFAVPTDSIAQKNGKYVYDPYFNNEKKETVKIQLPKTEHKEMYRIDFILPLHLDLLPNGVMKKTPSQSLVGVNFYEGMLMAMDSLEKSDPHYYDFVVHDISSGDWNAAVMKEKLEGTDLIVGALNAEEIPEVAQYALDKKVNFLSALSPSNADIQTNPFFIMMQPALDRHIQKLVNYGSKKFPFANNILLFSDASNDMETFTLLKEGLKKPYSEIKLASDSIDINTLTSFLMKDKDNVIYIAALSPKIGAKVIQQLQSLSKEYNIELMGMPSWKGMQELMNKKNESLDIFVTSPFSYDENYDKRMYIRELYDKFDRGVPSEMVFRGYETTLMAAKLLNDHGTIFNDHIDNYYAFANRYNITMVLDQDKNPMFYENNNLYIYKFNNGILSIVE